MPQPEEPTNNGEVALNNGEVALGKGIVEPLEHLDTLLPPHPVSKIKTKHDKVTCGRKNTRFLEDHCPLGADLGDLSYYDIKLDSNVSNSLRKAMNKYDRLLNY